jgi:hypothetical protein
VKTAYEIQESSSGKKEPVKIGLKPDQREGADYEFDLVGDLNLQHVMRVSKSRYPGTIDVNDEIENPNSELGQAIAAWLAEGVSLPSVQDYMDVALAAETTREELRRLHQQELPKRGLLGAALIDPVDGRATTLGAIVLRAGLERKAQEEAVEAEARAAAAAATAAAQAAAQAQQAATAPQATAEVPGVPAVAGPTAQQARLIALQEKAMNGWNELAAVEAVLAEAVAHELVTAQMPGPDGELHRVEALLTGRIAELRQYQQQAGSRPSDSGAAYAAAGVTNPQQDERGAA